MGVKTALVTGSTKGIGKAIALALLAKGAFVFLNYSHDEAAARELETCLAQKHPGQYDFIKADLSQIEGKETVFKHVCSRADYLSYLILNAGVTSRKPLRELTHEDWSYVLNTNLTIPFFMIQAFADFFEAEGRIISIGSVLGEYPHATSIPYGVSKAAVHFMVKQLVKEFADKRVTVNAIAAGFTNTPWQKEKPKEQIDRIANKTAAGRFAAPEEIADICMAVIDNAYVNGSVISINGGYEYR